MIAQPLVSTIVLCYNQSRFVVETLESVKAQTYKATQLIIVDDCSSDDSAAIIDRWLQCNGIQCTFIRHQENKGICKSLNEALAVANGKYISSVASDDVWLPDKLQHQVGILESQPAFVGVLYSDAFQMNEHGHSLPSMFIEAHRKLSEMPQGQILDALLAGNFIPAMSTLIRRSCYDEVGQYDESLPWEDWDMWLRIARQYSFVYSPIASAKYRIHDNSLSHSNRACILKGVFDICLKQFSLGNLNEGQKQKLISSMLDCSEKLKKMNDAASSNILWGLLQATGNRRALWVYRFRMSLSWRQRANKLHSKLVAFRNKLLPLLES